MKQVDIVIVGAGLVGASLAVSVARRCPELNIVLLEASESFPQYGANYDPRVVALTQASQNFLRSCNAWDEIERARCCAYTDMSVWDGEGNARIDFNCAEVHADSLGHIVENSIVVAALHRQLAELSNVQFLRPTNIVSYQREADKIQIELNDGREFEAPLLIAADGAESAVRKSMGFASREWNYGQRAIVTTVKTQLPHRHCARQRFMHTGPLAFLPLAGEHEYYCSIVWSCEDALADELMALDEANFNRRLTLAFEARLGEVEWSDKRYSIALRQRHAKHYIQPNVALVGDAAHTIHPLAGQGVNLGLLDAARLSDEIARAVARGVPLHDFSILRRYQRARLGENLSMMAAMEAFKRLFGSRDLCWQWLRNEGIRQLSTLALLKQFLIKQAMKL